ncbi:MAG: MerR family transcriptional regulator [Actinomycetales bacterium]|nr:MerR family transcriptional regulator [Actinomycetales bacterium]
MGHSVGEVARIAGVTVRALHHYDEIGLLRPSARTPSGYRSYDSDDLERLHRILAYRALGFPLDDVAALLGGDGGEAGEGALGHLERQHRLLTDRIAVLERMVRNLEKTMDAHRMGIRLDPHEMFEVFGDHDPTQHAEEAERRWGDTDAYRESARRSSSYTRADWERMRQETEAVNQALVSAMRSGLPADSPAAMAAAEEHRAHLGRWFYDCSREMHVGLAEMYLADPRFTRSYEDIAEGLARYVHDAIVANARATGAE